MKTFCGVLFLMAFAQASRAATIYQFRVHRTSFTATQMTTLLTKGETKDVQPGRVLQLLRVPNTNYFLLSGSTNGTSDWTYLNNLVKNGSIDVFKIYETREIYNQRIGVMEKFPPEIVVDNSAIYPVELPAVKKSSGT